MKILLIQPPLEDFYTTPIRLYPLGLLYTAKVFQLNGVEVRILDCLNPLKRRRIPLPPAFGYLEPFLRENPYFFKGYYRFGIEEEKVLAKIRAFDPDAVGISSQFTAYFKSVADVAAAIKAHFDLPVFIGGNHATVSADKILARCPHIDRVLAGPAEICIPQFLEEMGVAASKVDWKDILPERGLISGGAYRIGKKVYISLSASRGCPFACEFCSVAAMFGRRIEYRDPDAVIDEMRASRSQNQTSIFNFEDDNLSFNRKWFCAFLEAVSKESELRGVELTAMNGLCHSTLDEEILVWMKKAGFQRLNLSLVTRDDALQKSLHRPGSGQNMESLIREAHRLGFHITVYFIIGLPGQTRKEIRDTIDYLFDQKVLVGPSIFYLPPGSALYDRLFLPEALKDNWELYRSSAFALETEDLSRKDLVNFFTEVRVRNLSLRG